MAIMLATLAKMPEMLKLVSKDDIELFRRRGCGICESTLMIAPHLPHASPTVKPLPGQKWVRDTCQVKVMQLGTRNKYFTTYWDAGSSKCRTYWHGGMTAEDFIMIDQQLRLFNRPHRGEVLIIQADCLPAQMAKDVKDYHVGEEILSAFSVPYFHQQVGGAESSFRHTVYPELMPCCVGARRTEVMSTSPRLTTRLRACGMSW
jgi:hypothetical protein